MLFAYNGGMWCAGPHLLCTLKCCGDKTAVIEDLYETPVRIDVDELINLATQHWQEQMNAWLCDLEEQNNRR